MAIQIKNKYLKRLLKKTKVMSKKMGGSSTIENIIKGGTVTENITNILTERAKALFSIARIKKAADTSTGIGEAENEKQRNAFGSATITETYS